MRLLAIVPGLLTLAAGSPVPAPAPSVRAENERRLVAAKTKIMAADYAADLVALRTLRDEVQPLAAAAPLRCLALYWSGFASWRLAINGASAGMKNDELVAHLERASADFEASLYGCPDLADAWAAAASVTGWLGGLTGARDPAAAEARWQKMRRLLARAEELEPDNPRVLWVVGGNFLFSPASRGGSHARAVLTYRRAIELPDEPGRRGTALPDWGKAECWMALAYAHLNQPVPDAKAALEEAKMALRLQPDWHYVKNVLIPDIQERMSR